MRHNVIIYGLIFAGLSLVMLVPRVIASQTEDLDSGPYGDKVSREAIGYILTPPAKRRITQQYQIIDERYRKTGRTLNCISMVSVRESDALSDTMIWFRLLGRKGYINTTRGPCARLAQNDRFFYQTTQSRVCKGDVITTTDDFGISTGSCGLGYFEEYEKLPTGGDAD